MQIRELEKTLRGLAEAEEAKIEAREKWRPRGLLRAIRRKRKEPAPGRNRRSDFVVAGLGITLGIGCAVFPWYIFMNQDQFGVRAMKFEGNGAYDAPIELGSSGERVGAPMSPNEIPPMKLDLFATGTVADNAEASVKTVEPVEQPFPGEPVAYRMVYAAAGRAMIADDAGFFVVQRGSLLPDNSKVASIEQRKGKWVLVTSEDRVLDLSRE